MPEQISPKELYERTKKTRKGDRGGASVNWPLMIQRISGIVFFVVALVGVGWLGYTKLGIGKFDPTTTCITAESYHIHPHVIIKINGETQKIPSNIGSFPCTVAFHTHAEDGIIHIENAFPFDATLGQFFAVWKKPFNRDQVLDAVADDTREIIMTVDGQPSDAYENLILKDKQEIVIEYREKQ